MTRVLHLSSGNLYGGIETLLTTLAGERALCPEMVPEYGLCFEGRLSSELRTAGVGLHVVGKVRFSRPWTVWFARRRVRQLLAEIRPDVVVTHACWPHSVFALAVRDAGLPLVFWAHDVANMSHWLDRKAARIPPDFVIANSNYTASTLHRLFPGVPHAVVYSPVRRAPGDTGRRADLRREFDTAADDVVLLAASRLEPWKGHALLLEALTQLRDRRGWTCWIAGGAQRPHEVEYLGELKRQVEAGNISGRVRWLGERSDVPDLLAAADVFCQTNQRPEPFGIIFIEAMHAGRPIASVRLGGAAEIIDNTCGRLAEPGSTTSIARTLSELIESSQLRHSLGEAGPTRARDLCDTAVQLSALHERLRRVSAAAIPESTGSSNGDLR